MRILDTILWYLAAENCRHCLQKYAEPGLLLCAHCARQIFFFDPTQRCLTCGSLLKNGTCSFCLNREVFFSRAEFSFLYTAAGRTLLKEAKFHNSKRALAYLKTNLRLPNFLNQISYILPLPSSKGLAHFTANALQQHSSAQLLSGVFHLPRKKKDTKKLAQDERFSQLENLILSPKPAIPATSSIIIVDDIFTSGATLNRSARLVHEVWQVPREQIFCYALFRRDALREI